MLRDGEETHSILYVVRPQNSSSVVGVVSEIVLKGWVGSSNVFVLKGGYLVSNMP